MYSIEVLYVIARIVRMRWYAKNFAHERVNTKLLCNIKVCLKAQTITRKSFDLAHRNPYCYTNGNLYTNRHKSKHHTSWVPDLR